MLNGENEGINKRVTSLVILKHVNHAGGFAELAKKMK